MNIQTIDFGLGDDINMLRDAVQDFANNEIAPRAAQVDVDNEFPADLWRKFGDMGLLGVTVGEEYGGSNMASTIHRLKWRSRNDNFVGFIAACLCVSNTPVVLRYSRMQNRQQTKLASVFGLRRLFAQTSLQQALLLGRPSPNVRAMHLY